MVFGPGGVQSGGDETAWSFPAASERGRCVGGSQPGDIDACSPLSASRVEWQGPEGAASFHQTGYHTLRGENAEVETSSPRWCDLKSLSLLGRDTLFTLFTHHTLQDTRAPVKVRK